MAKREKSIRSNKGKKCNFAQTFLGACSDGEGSLGDKNLFIFYNLKIFIMIILLVIYINKFEFTYLIVIRKINESKKPLKGL